MWQCPVIRGKNLNAHACQCILNPIKHIAEHKLESLVVNGKNMVG